MASINNRTIPMCMAVVCAVVALAGCGETQDESLETSAPPVSADAKPSNPVRNKAGQETAERIGGSQTAPMSQ